jgi:hypothetical protein
MQITQHAINRMNERFQKYNFWQIYELVEEALKYGQISQDGNRITLGDITCVVYSRNRNPKLITLWPN